MLSVKTRKQGNSLMLTIPKSFDIGIDQEFYAIKKENGSLIYTPVIKDFFEDAKVGEYYDPEFSTNYKPIGTEKNYD